MAPAGEEWRQEATGINPYILYVHDWVDEDAWDRYLYEHYGEHRIAMRETIELRLDAFAHFARTHNIPAVIGEGYVGYTLLDANFEESPVGKVICDVVWQQRLNARILG